MFFWPFTEREHKIKREKIGICDIVGAAYRDKVDASDLGMKKVVLRDLLDILGKNPNVDSLIFTGGNSKNGPEYFFRQLLKKQGLSLLCVDDQVPRKHLLEWAGRTITTFSLTAPSGTANRAIGSMQEYKTNKANDPQYTPFDFRVAQYGKVFKNLS